MPTEFKVSLAEILKELGFEAIYMPQNPDEVMVTSMELSRPGLELAGFFDYYDNTRIVVFGQSEMAFLQEMEPARRNEIIDALFSRHAPAVLITRGQEPPEVLLSSSRRYSVPLLRTQEVTSSAIMRLTSFLNIELAPRVTDRKSVV